MKSCWEERVGVYDGWMDGWEGLGAVGWDGMGWVGREARAIHNKHKHKYKYEYRKGGAGL